MNGLTRRHFTGGALGLLGAARLTGSAHAQGADTRSYKIGVLAGLSGLGSQIGQWILQGAEVGVEALNREAGRPRFSIISEDRRVRSAASRASTAGQRRSRRHRSPAAAR